MPIKQASNQTWGILLVTAFVMLTGNFSLFFADSQVVSAQFASYTVSDFHFAVL